MAMELDLEMGACLASKRVLNKIMAVAKASLADFLIQCITNCNVLAGNAQPAVY